jgi:stage III sporulation protein AB
MALLIRHRALPLGDLFTELSHYGLIRSLIRNRETEAGSSFRESWYCAADELTELGESERAIVKSIGRSLGTSDTDGQLAMLAVNSALLTKHGDEAHEQYIKKGKLYRSFGLLAGLFTAILLM